MWLLNTKSRQLEYLNDVQAIQVGYAILSHTWGKEEVTFKEIQEPTVAKAKEGYIKIEYTCRQAEEDGLRYAWIDTCCIDKSSSSELSEAINSMFRWYKDCTKCYAYLHDIDLAEITEENVDVILALRKKRWFTRGWTLQELIAPKSTRMHFYAKDWVHIGRKKDLCTQIERVTSIPMNILRDSRQLTTASVAKKMSWAAKRNTTRPEDQAYCLLGIFDVNMPMLYGEGSKAFRRLQEAILESSHDPTFLLWEPLTPGSRYNLLAPSPLDFKYCGNIVKYVSRNAEPYELTNVGVRMSLPLTEIGKRYYVVLDCTYENDFTGLIALEVESLVTDAANRAVLQPCRTNVAVFGFERRHKVIPWSDLQLISPSQRSVILVPEADLGQNYILKTRIIIQPDMWCEETFRLVEYFPEKAWNTEAWICSWTSLPVSNAIVPDREAYRVLYTVHRLQPQDADSGTRYLSLLLARHPNLPKATYSFKAICTQSMPKCTDMETSLTMERFVVLSSEVDEWQILCNIVIDSENSMDVVSCYKRLVEQPVYIIRLVHMPRNQERFARGDTEQVEECSNTERHDRTYVTVDPKHWKVGRFRK